MTTEQMHCVVCGRETSNGNVCRACSPLPKRSLFDQVPISAQGWRQREVDAWYAHEILIHGSDDHIPGNPLDFGNN